MAPRVICSAGGAGQGSARGVCSMNRRILVATVCLLLLIGYALARGEFENGDAPKTSQVSAQIVVDRSQQAVWGKLRDLSLADRYMPGIIRTQITTEQKSGVGTTRKVFESDTSSLDETVVAWKEGNGFVLRVHEGENGVPFPFLAASLLYWVDRVDEGHALVTVSLQYVPRGGALGRLLDHRFLKTRIRSKLDGVAVNLKRFVEAEGGETDAIALPHVSASVPE